MSFAYLTNMSIHFCQENFAYLACKPLKQYKTLSSAVCNTCVPVSIPGRYLFVTPARLPCLVYSPWFSYLAWTFLARAFLFGFCSPVFLILLELSWLGCSCLGFCSLSFQISLSFRSLGVSAWAFAVLVFQFGLSFRSSGFSAWAFKFCSPVFLMLLDLL